MRFPWAVVLLLTLLAGCGSSESAGDEAPSQAEVHFYGRVVDQDGKPVPGVTVAAEACKMTPGMMAGEPIVDRTTSMPLEAISDDDGRFTLTIPPGYQTLTINDVQKAGYGWIHDWMWSGGAIIDLAKNNNTNFQFAGAMSVARTYMPDSTNLAIYPLHADGTPEPVGEPSRGGSDRYPSGKVTHNQPVAVVLPSAGPDSPGDEYQAIVDAIARVASERARAATQPTRPATATNGRLPG